MGQPLLQFSWPLRVYYEDTDAGGVVFYANYLKFMERARTEWLRACGIEQDGLLAQQIAFMVRSAHLEYLSPARFNEQLVVNSTIDQLRGASIIFAQEIIRPNGQVACSGRVKVACVDLERNAPVAIPDVVRGALTGER